MFDNLYTSIIYAEEFKKILFNKDLSNLEVAGAYLAYIYKDLPITGRNICAGFLRIGLDSIFATTAKFSIYSPKHKLYVVPRKDGICIGCNYGRSVVKVADNGYEPKDILESKSLEPRVLISKKFREKAIEIIEETLDLSNIRLKAKKEILNKMLSISINFQYI